MDIFKSMQDLNAKITAIENDFKNNKEYVFTSDLVIVNYFYHNGYYIDYDDKNKYMILNKDYSG